MCIISVKDTGVDMPSEQIIRTMFTNNPDGAGFMLLREGETQTILSKGYMTVDKFLEDINKMKVKKDDRLVMHFRIETSGGVNQGLCHPFVISEEEKEIKQILVTTEKTCFAHNGIIYDLNRLEKDNSDTAIFARDYLSKPHIYENIFTCFAVQEFIEQFIDGSRMVFMHPDHELLMLGDWEFEDDGMMYSNTTYKKSKYSSCNYGKSYISPYGGGGRSYQDGYDTYDDFYDGTVPAQDTEESTTWKGNGYSITRSKSGTIIETTLVDDELVRDDEEGMRPDPTPWVYMQSGQCEWCKVDDTTYWDDDLYTYLCIECWRNCKPNWL